MHLSGTCSTADNENQRNISQWKQIHSINSGLIYMSKVCVEGIIIKSFVNLKKNLVKNRCVKYKEKQLI